MEKDKVQDYINKLMELNSEISEDSEVDDSDELDENFIQTLNQLYFFQIKDISPPIATGYNYRTTYYPRFKHIKTATKCCWKMCAS